MNSSRNEDTIGFKPDVFVYLVFGFGGKTRMNNMITLLFRRWSSADADPKCGTVISPFGGAGRERE